MTARINWKCNAFGRGAQAYVSRKVIQSLVAMGADVSVENVRPQLRSGEFVGPELRDLLLKLIDRSIDARQFCHIRKAGLENEDKYLIEGYLDVSPFGQNVWFRPITTSRRTSVRAETLVRYLDAIWAPSEHSRRAAVESGMDDQRVFVVMLGVDSGVFTPDGERAPLPGARAFRFLHSSTPMIMEHKGIDVLLRAFYAAFSDDDDASLTIHTRKKHGIHKIERLIAELDSKNRHPPAVNIYEANLNEENMARLYRGADCLVHPSRAEAFCLTVLEAMACGLPTIVTGWGGQIEFCTPASSYFISYTLTLDGLTLVGEEGGGLWAEPDVAHLAHLMRTAYLAPTAAAEKGQEARKIALGLSWERTAARVVELVEAMQT